MKSRIILLLLFLTFSVKAQFVKLHDFLLDNNLWDPSQSLITDGTRLFGVAPHGGKAAEGSIFALNKNGSQLVTVHEFNYNDGRFPYSTLCIDDTMLFGVTYGGGNNDYGVIYKVSTNGNSFTVLYRFDQVSGGASLCSLTLSGDTIFGNSSWGGINYCGTIFRLRKDGSDFKKLFDFSSSDGYWPSGALLVNGNILYGATDQGGLSGIGTIFRINTDGSGYTKLYSFTSDIGAHPIGKLVLYGNYLYGQSGYGGSFYNGLIFRVSKYGNGFSKLYDFKDSDGSIPLGPLTVKDNYLYGMTSKAGSYSGGTLFKFNMTGMKFTKIHDFTVQEGNSPIENGQPLLMGSTIYGITSMGGANSRGAFFKCDLSDSTFTTILQCSSSLKGSKPIGNLVSDGIRLYGLASSGGQYGFGLLYKMNGDGSGYSVIMNFSEEVGTLYDQSQLQISGSILFWASASGGKNKLGAIYSIQTNGTGFRTIFDFQLDSGGCPTGKLLASDSIFYGVGSCGNMDNRGIVYKIDKNGSNFKILRRFGANNLLPTGSLIQDSSWLYGIIYGENEIANLGGIYRIKTDGSNYTLLHDFKTESGAIPCEPLMFVGTDIYGVTFIGGQQGQGVIFKMHKDGTGYSVINNLDQIGCSSPNGGLTFYKNKLYGTAARGGANGLGGIFMLDTSGTHFVKLVDFDSELTGSDPKLPLTIQKNILYGINYSGGKDLLGTIFSFTTPGFTKQPDSLIAICPDGNASIDVAAEGSELTYKWQHSNDSGILWKDISVSEEDTIYSGNDSPYLTITNLSNDMNGYLFRCIITDSFGLTDTSKPAMLMTNIPLYITFNPSDTSICAGGFSQFKIISEGIQPEYQWQLSQNAGFTNLMDDSIYSGSNTSRLIIHSKSGLDNTRYRCIATASCGEKDTSNVGRLFVQTSPAICLEPKAVELSEGDSTVLLVKAFGTANTYQWQVNSGNGWTDVKDPGIYRYPNLDSMVLPKVQAEMNGNIYRCLIAGTCPPADTSMTVRLCVDASSIIVSQPESVEVPERRDTSFSVSAIGAFLRYRWEENSGISSEWNSIVDNEFFQGSYSPVLKVKNISMEMNNYQFRCIASGNCGNEDTSKVATLNAIFNSNKGHYVDERIISCYPNPAQNDLNIRFSDPRNGKIALEIYTLTGQEIYVTETIKNESEFNARIMIGNFPQGIYYLKVLLNDSYIGRTKLSIVR
jgi:uncharacterized repeat protein (TIGR03803 family)